MNNEKFTPGPWNIEIITPPSNCTCYLIENKMGAEHGKESEANANLIAAAPDMYEALKKCLKIFNQLADAGRYPEPMMVENGGEGFGFIEAAISKANPQPSTVTY